jgi:hypothetical protein
MSVADILPWLNVLLIPTLGGIVKVAVSLARLEANISAHSRLDDERFGEVRRRLDGVEQSHS